MKSHSPSRFSFSSCCLLLALCLLVVLGSGCQTVSLPKPKPKPYEPANFAATRTHLAPELVNVAVMPPEVQPGTATGYDPTLRLLQQVHQSELMKTRAFGVRLIRPDMLKPLLGRQHVRANQPMPEALFQVLREQLDCQAVLFSQLTTLRTMAPMKMGWHMKLIDTDTLETIWEIDEIFDAGNIHVAAAAEDYYETQLSAAFRKPDAELVLASPRLFGQYTLDSVFSTLPPRK